MADIEKLTVTLEANVAAYNADLQKAAQTTAQQTQAMENSFAKMFARSQDSARSALQAHDASAKIGQGFADLAKSGARVAPTFDKLSAGMQSVGKAALQSQIEQELLNKSLGDTGDAAVGVSHAIGAMSTQGMAAFHALRGGTEMLAQGVSPMRVLAMEMNNLTYAASGSGGLKGAFMEAFGIFKGMLNPVVALTSGIVGLGLAMVGVGASFARSQSKIDLALTGVGKSAGITVGAINQIAESVSKAGDLSTSEASDIATAIASTGRASAETTEKATRLAHAYSLVFDKDLTKSAHDLAGAISDPGHAIDGLNERLGAWSARQVELVKNLALSGQREQAARIIIDGMEKAIGKAANKTDFWTRSWTSLSNAISNAITAAGKGIDEAAGIRTPEDALAIAQARLKELQQGRTGPRGGTTFGTPQEIAAVRAEVDRLTASIKAEAKAEDDRRGDTEVSAIIKDIDPTIQKLNELQATITRIKNQPITDEAALGVRDKVVESLQTEHDFLLKNLDAAKQRYGVASAELGISARQNALDIAAINARTPAQKAEIAYQQTLNGLLASGKGQREAEIEAQFQRTKTLTEAEHALSEVQRDRIYQAGQTVEQAQLENTTVGQSIDVVTTLTQRFQLLAAARAEAHKNGTVVSPEELAAMDEAARKLGQLAAAQAALNVQNDARFDIAQLGRSQSEQSVYGTLQSAGLLTNGQIVSEQAKQTAEVLRTKEALSQLADVEKGFASSFLHDLIQGKSAAEALGNALNNVASKLLDVGIDKLISGSGLTGGIGSLLGFANGGVFVPGMGSQPLKRFAGGGVSRNAAIFGEAGPEAAVPLPDGRRIPVDLRMPKVAATPAQSAPNVNITINAPNSTKESVDALNANTLPKIREIVRSEILQTANRSAAFKKAVR